MKRRVLYALWAILLGTMLGGETAWGYAKPTHKFFNENIYAASSLEAYLVNELKFPRDSAGVLSWTYQGKAPLEYFWDAGKTEDSSDLINSRGHSHFHDPLNAWNEAGYTNPLWFNGNSSLLWAQYDLLKVRPWTISGENEWTWQRANASLLAGLTSESAEVRDRNMADLFSTLGHLTHLIADMSVPDHTRNDGHLWSIENWCESKIEGPASPLFGTPASRAEHAPADAIFAQNQGNGTYLWEPLSPVSNLWDSYPERTDIDKGYNGALFVQEGKLAGLADYSNFNYFSDDTVFSSKYDYPSRSGSVPYVSDVTGIVIPPGGIPYTDRVVYFRGWTSDEIEVPHLAAADLLYQEWSQLPPDEQRQVPAHLDDNCYQDYASNLVPRAVSYGTKLVDYFFRAKFLVTAVGNQLTVENLSTGKASGVVTVYADMSGTRSPVYAYNIDDLQPNDSFTFESFSPPVTQGLQYLAVFDGQIEDAGPETNMDWVVGGHVFIWSPAPELPSVIDVGDNPHGMALTPRRDKLYVTNYSANTVSVINAAQRQVIAVIPVGSGPTDVAIAGSRAFVSNERGNSVSVIDIASDTVEHTISGLPAWPEEMAVTPDGAYVFLAHWSSRPLTRINTATLAYDLIPSPMRPCQGIAIKDTSAFLTYYTFYWRKSVGVVDLSTLGLTATIPGPDLNWSAAISGTSLYVAHPQVNAVSAYDTANNTLIATLPVAGSPRGVAAGSDGKVYVARLLDDKVSVIDASNNTVVEEIAAGDGAYDVVVDNQAGYLYVSNAFADTVSVIPLGGGAAPLMAMAGASLMSERTPTDAASLATVVLHDFPPEGRVLIDGEFPRGENLSETGREFSVTPGIHELLLACPGYLTKTIAVNGLPGEYIVEDGLLAAE